MSETRHDMDETLQIETSIARLNSGDASVRGELLNVACTRLMQLTAEIKQEFDQADKAASKNLDDVFAGVSTRLYEALHDVSIRDERHFHQLAARQIRLELIDLCSQVELADDSELGSLIRFHRAVDDLPAELREVFELVWYHDLSIDEAARVTQQSESELRRLWRAARLGLHERLGDDEEDDANEPSFEVG